MVKKVDTEYEKVLFTHLYVFKTRWFNWKLTVIKLEQDFKSLQISNKIYKYNSRILIGRK